MLASLAIDMLSVCGVMLGAGWAYDVIAAAASPATYTHVVPTEARGV